MSEEYSKNVLIQAASRVNNEANNLGGLVHGGLAFEFEELGDTVEAFAAAKLRIMAKRVAASSNYRESMIEAAKLIAQLSTLKPTTGDLADIPQEDFPSVFKTNPKLAATREMKSEELPRNASK